MSVNPNNAISIRCGSCQSVLQVEVASSGKTTICPKCQSNIRVPELRSAANESVVHADTAAQSSIASDSSADPVVSTESESMASESVATSTNFKTPTGSSVASSGGVRSILELVQEGENTKGHQLYKALTQEIAKVFVGQDELVLGTLVGLFASGHVLIESVPGLGKTLLVRALGKVLGCQFGRIQFTPDLMPSDITGAPIFNFKTQEFHFHPGPIFTQLLLADEINRAPAKTHAALLETMQEYRVSVDGKVHKLDRPFFVLATQNPIESEGTYNLPEAQLDRFMFQLKMDYPSVEDEVAILRMHGGQNQMDDQLDQLEAVTDAETINELFSQTDTIRVDDRIIDYITTLVRKTRSWPQIHLGASPRAGITLMRAGRTLAMFAGRDFVIPDDIVHMFKPALRHRIILTPETEVEGYTPDQVLEDVVRSVEVPRFE